MEFRLYGYDRNPRTRLVRIIAELEGIRLKCIEVIPRENIRKAEYMAKFPLSQGKIPAVEGPQLKLTETIAIVTFFAWLSNTSKLLGDGSIEEESQVLSYLSWANHELLQTLALWYLPLIPGFTDLPSYNESAVLDAKNKSLKLLAAVELLLTGKDWMVGNHMTLADVMLAIYISRGFEWVLGADWRGLHPNIMKHFHSVTENEAVKKVIPKFILIEEETQIKDPYKGT
jgi:elongation factor 1-gamma